MAPDKRVMRLNYLSQIALPAIICITHRET
jgi:hypothetical protein